MKVYLFIGDLVVNSLLLGVLGVSIRLSPSDQQSPALDVVDSGEGRVAVF